MARRPVTGLLSQYAKNAGGASASGYWLKFFSASYGATTSPLIMYTRQSGGVGLSKCKLNTRGEPISDSGDNDSTFIPYINGDWDAYIFFTEADADANNTVNSIYLGTNVQPEPDFSTRAIVQFADVDGMINGYAIDGSSVDYNVLTDNGAWKPKVSTVVNNTTSKKGGADYIIKTAAQVAADGDVIDGYGNHWLLGGSSYAAIIVLGDYIDLESLGSTGYPNDDTTIFAAALSMSTLKRLRVVCTLAKYAHGAITVSNRAVLDYQWADVEPTGDVDLVLIQGIGSKVMNVRYDIRLITYTSQLVTVRPIDSPSFSNRMILASEDCWGENIKVLNSGTASGPKDGKCFLLDCKLGTNGDGSIAFQKAKGLSADFVNTFIELRADRTGGSNTYCNGNIFEDCIVYYANNPLIETAILDGDVAGNDYDVQIQCKDSADLIQLQDQARLAGVIWDSGTLRFNGSENQVIAMRGTDFAVQDRGTSNRIISRSGEYFDQKGTAGSEDKRNGVGGEVGYDSYTLPMYGENIDPVFRQTSVGTPTVTSSSSIIGNSGAGRPVFAPIWTMLTNTAGDTLELDWGGTGAFCADQLPRFFGTFRYSQGTTYLNAHSGFYKDSSNFILIKTDQDEFGDRSLRFVCRSGGVETVVDSGHTPLFNEIILTEIIVNPTPDFTGLQVGFRIGWDLITSSNLSQGRFLMKKAGQNAQATITTNIPSEQFMELYLKADSPTSTSAALQIHHLQANWRKRAWDF